MARVAMLVSNVCAPDPRVEKEACSLAEAGHDVVIYAFDRWHEQAAVTELARGARIERIRPPLPLPRNMAATRLGLAYFHATARQRLLRTPAEVVHCHDHDTCSVGVWWQHEGARKAGLPRGRFVYDAHDLYWTWAVLPDPGARWRQGLAAALRWQDRKFARRADLLITVTEGTTADFPGTAELYRAWGCDALVIWNAPLPPVAIPALPERFTVGYLGNVREPAMFRNLIAALELLPAAERPAVRIAGTGRSAEEVEWLLGEARGRLGDLFQQSGAFTSEDVPALMAECSVQYCVYPMQRGNIDRAMPVKLLESVAYGRRVIGNAGSLMGEWIRAHDWGWQVREDDPAALAHALREARSRAAADGSRAPVLAPPPLWPEQAGRLVEAYTRLLR